MHPVKKLIGVLLIGFFCEPCVWAAKKGPQNPFPPDQFYDPQIILEDAVARLDLAYVDLKKKGHETFGNKKNAIQNKLAQKKISRKGANRSIANATKSLENRLAFLEKNYQQTKKILSDRYTTFLQAKQKETPVIKSMNLPLELYKLLEDCRSREKMVRWRFYQEKRQIERSLSSLERGDFEKQYELKKARKRMGKELAEIQDDCRGKERQLRDEYRKLYKKEQKELQEAWKKELALQKKRDKEEGRKKKKEPQVVSIQKGRAALPWNDFWKSWRMHGIFKEEVAYRISKPTQFSKIKSLLNLSQTAKWSDDLRFKFSERAYYDSVFSLTDNNYPDNVKDDQEWQVELRDAFFDYSQGAVDWRIGKQQIVWGDAMALFVADMVNGKDLREYILPEFEQIRLNQWSGVMTYTEGVFTGEVIVSFPEFHRTGVAGSEFAFPLPLPTNYPYRLNPTEEPTSSLNNSDVGGKMSFLLGGLDLGVFLLHTWEKFPIYERKWNWFSLIYTPIYERKDVLGLTFSKDISDSILKGEFVFTPSQPFTTTDPHSVDGLDSLPVFDYVVGIDHTFGKIETNLQILQRLVSGDTKYLVNETNTRTHISFWIKTDIFNKKFEPQILAIVGLKEKDHLYRPKLVWNLSGSTRLNFGADIFVGYPNTGLFGIFENRDRIYTEYEFHF